MKTKNFLYFKIWLALIIFLIIFTNCVKRPDVTFNNPYDPQGINYNSPFNAIKIASASEQSFALKSDGTLWATGYNEDGRLGTGDNTSRNVFVQVLSGVSAIAAGRHSLALKNDGTLWAAGENKSGQLGTGDTNNRNVFVQVLSGVSAIAAGWEHSLVLKSDGTLWATGRNDYGELGTGDYNNRNVFVQIYQH